jgi:hypothetical protein
MLHSPIPLALWICDRIIVDAATNDLSLIGSFTGLKFEQFPTFPRPLSVFLSLTGADGHGKITLSVLGIDAEGDFEQVYTRTEAVVFRQRALVENVHFRIRDLRFPRKGTYSFAVFVDGLLVAERKLRLIEG